MYKASNISISAACELVLQTHFPGPPSELEAGRPIGGDIGTSSGLDLAQKDNARLTHGVFLSALAAVLLLRNYRRIRRLSDTVLRGSALDNNRTINRGQGSYHTEDASDAIALWQSFP